VPVLSRRRKREEEAERGAALETAAMPIQIGLNCGETTAGPVSAVKSSVQV